MAECDEDVRALIPSAGTEAEAPSELYRDVMLYLPVLNPDVERSYAPCPYARTTRKQLAAKLRLKGQDMVARVASEPGHLLLLGNCLEAQDIETVELSDGTQLAVVVDGVEVPTAKLVQRLEKVDKQVGVTVMCVGPEMEHGGRGVCHGRDGGLQGRGVWGAWEGYGGEGQLTIPVHCSASFEHCQASLACVVP